MSGPFQDERKGRTGCVEWFSYRSVASAGHGVLASGVARGGIRVVLGGLPSHAVACDDDLVQVGVRRVEPGDDLIKRVVGRDFTRVWQDVVLSGGVASSN